MSINNRSEMALDLSSPEMVTSRARQHILNEVYRMYADSNNPIARTFGPRRYQRMLEKRIAAETAWAADLRNTPEVDSDWSQGSGSYQNSFLANRERRPSSEEYDPEKLAGDELILDANITELLERRRETKKPVVVMDFGGVYGASMIRLATRHKTDVEEGRLVILVTNLAYTPNTQQEQDQDGYTGVAHSIRAREREEGLTELTPDLRKMLDFIQTNQSLVRYLVGTAPELPNQIPGGQVDILNESYALRHVHAPDVALAVFGELLSAEGTLYLTPQIENSAMHSIRLPNGKTIDPKSRFYTDSRDKALEVGMGLLQNQYGMTKAYDNGKNVVYIKASAPKFPPAQTQT